MLPSVAAAYRNQVMARFPSDRNNPEAIAFAQATVNEITGRLLHDSPEIRVLVDVVDVNEILAFSYPGGIVLSSGLLRRLPNEAMCAFVLAHEISHHMLGHINETSTNEYSMAAEMAADRRAVALMASAAYDIRLALDTITALSPILHNNLTEVSERRGAINDFIKQSKWRPPGTITRRVYQEMWAGLFSPF